MASQGGKEDLPIEIIGLLVVVLLCILAWLIWTFFKPAIVYPTFAINLGLLFPFEKLGFLNNTGKASYDFVLAVFDGRLDPFAITWDEFAFIKKVVYGIYKWPFVIIMALMAIIIIFKMKGGGMSRKFALKGGRGFMSLPQYQSIHWRYLKPGVMFDPDSKNEPMEPARTPPEWLHHNGIDYQRSVGLDIQKVTAALERQMGESWVNFASAKPHIRAFAALCIINARREKKGKFTPVIKGDIAVIWSDPDMSYDQKAIKSEEALKPFLQDGKTEHLVNKYAGKHAYVTTALYELLIIGRRHGGVFAAAEFLWIKSIDRNLWYVLNNAGRKAFFVEGAGPISHYHYEKMKGKPIIEPRLNEAVDGIVDYLETNGIVSLDRLFNMERDF